MRTLAWLPLLCVIGCGSTVVAGPGTRADAGADSADGAPPPDAPVTDVPVAPDVPSVVDVPVTPDVPVMPDVPVTSDVPTGMLPLGAMCTSDAECMSGVCVRGAGLSPGCAQPCRRDVDCLPLGVTFNCALDRVPTGGRWVCGEVPGAGEDPGNLCTTNTDCFSNLCTDAHCRNPCVDDTECTPGWRCIPQPAVASGTSCAHPAISGVTVERYTLAEQTTTTGRGTMEERLIVPSDAVSITWTTQDMEGSNLFAAVGSVRSPDNDALVDLRTWTILRDQPIRTLPSRYQFNAATLPSNDTLRVSPGTYNSIHLLYNDRTTMVASRRLRAQALVKRAPGGMFGTTWRLRIGVWFVGIPGISAATAPSNRRLQTAIATMRSIWAAANVGVEVVGYQDIVGADATRYSVIDSRQELQELFQRTAGAMGPALNLLMVRGISSAAGLENAIGIAGAINGPAGVHGTVQSGVVAGWETTLGRVDLLPQVMAHECGHYVGLWHTRENLAACTSATQMDCSIFGGVDPIGDTPTDTRAAANLMYWQTATGANTALSPGQSIVMRAHPLVQ